MKIDKDILTSVAKNARLKLTPKEEELFLEELNKVLETFSQIRDIDTEKVEPLFQPMESINVTREDEVSASLATDDALKNTRHKKDNYFKGPKV